MGPPFISVLTVPDGWGYNTVTEAPIHFACGSWYIFFYPALLTGEKICASGRALGFTLSALHYSLTQGLPGRFGKPLLA